MKLILCLVIFFSIFKTIAEERVYQFPVTSESQSQLIYTLELMAFFQTIYQPQVLQRDNTRFGWDFNWEQNYLGAGSKLVDGEFSILLWGGFIRGTYSTFEVVAATLCHEFGHYLGGTPRQRLEDKANGDWSTAEGQSDWFAASICLAEVYDYFKKKFPHRIQVQQDSAIEKLCQNSIDIKKCRWISFSGLKFVQFIHYHYERDSVKPSLIQKSQEHPQNTIHSQYPSLQCRLDTYTQGALCAGSPGSQACERPRCWFNPLDPLNN